MITAQALSLTLEATSECEDYILNKKCIGIIKGTKPDIHKIDLSIFAFTSSGVQLMKAIQPECSEQYLFDYLQFIADEHRDFSIIAHKINSISEDGNVNYNTDVAFTIERR